MNDTGERMGCGERKSGEPCVVVGLGELLWDLLPAGKQLGGAPANFAYQAQNLGARSAVVSAVGDDAFGQEILDALVGFGLGTQHVALDTQHPTGTVSVELDESGIPNYIIHEGAAWDYMQPAPELLKLAESCDVVCFGSLAQRSPVSRATILQFLDTTRAGCMRVFDINLRQSYYDTETIRESLRRADVLKLNDEELPIVAKLLSVSDSESDVLMHLLSEFDLDVIALTRGGEGSVLRTPTEESVHPGVPCAHTEDTVGAGDCFTARLAMGLVRGEPLDVINDQANRLASYVCSRKGAMPPMSEGIEAS